MTEKNIIEQVLPLLIEDNLNRRKGNAALKESLSKVIYLMHIATIEIKLARRSGHTTAIENMADPEQDLIIITHNRPHKLPNVISFHEIRRGFFLGKRKDKYRRIFIDDASQLFEQYDRLIVYNELAKMNVELVIALG